MISNCEVKMCTKCGAVIPPGKKKCEKHTEVKREMTAEEIAKLHERWRNPKPWWGGRVKSLETDG